MKSTDECIAALKGKDEHAHRAALAALKNHGAEAKRAIPTLLAFSVNASQPGFRSQARALLDQIDFSWRQQEGVSAEILSLTFLLDDFDKELGARAEERLAEIGPLTIDYVLDVALEMDEDRRAAALRVLEGMSAEWHQLSEVWKKAGDVLEKVESKYEEVAAAAEDMLVLMAEGAVTPLLHWLVSPLLKRRKIAQRLLVRISEDWHEMVPVEEIEDTLLPHLDSSFSDVVEEVRRILYGMADRSLPFLIDLLEPHARTEETALLQIVQLVGKMANGDPRIPELLMQRWPKTENSELRAAIILALHRSGFDLAEALMPQLLADLDHPADEVKLEAMAYLTSLGRYAEPAAIPLAQMLSSGKDELVAAARQALEAIGIEAGPSLAAVLKDNDRAEILNILREYESTFTTSELQRVKLDPVQALRNMGWNVAFAKDAMARLTQRKLIAMQVIEQIDYQGPELVGFLQGLLDSDHDEIREMATKLYKRMRFF